MAITVRGVESRLQDGVLADTDLAALRAKADAWGRRIAAIRPPVAPT